jgi:hypothetical protein
VNPSNADVADLVKARPVRTARIGYALAVVVFATFVVVALVMRRANDGVPFSYKDQWGTAFVGFVLAGLCLMPTRPRLRADREAIRTRAFLGGWRTIPWAAVVRLDFPRNVRFARIVLPAEEAIAIYAVQRWDGQRAVVAMRGLRALLEASRAEARGRDA